jgi:hypothetical protein
MMGHASTRAWLIRVCTCAALGLCGCTRQEASSTLNLETAIPERPDYNWDVRPILSQNCFACHGNDRRKAGLRLDDPKIAYAPVPEDPANRAIVPGDVESSEMIRRIRSADLDERMPPRETHKVLSAREIAILTRWVQQGAKYKQHWAYIPPKETPPKLRRQDARGENPVDVYVRAKLQKERLAPAPEADRETLINRVTLDLTGLPPTLEEVDAFAADSKSDAYDRLVDRLLASRAYAERQANIWLDVARYADSDGFLFDQTGRFQFPYRDWVISAFERNLPYDQFVTWQIAGDQLPDPTREQIVATAFARMGKRSNEGGIIDEEYRVEYAFERTELIGKAFLGLTVGCAKCHDHKYDIISQRDFYSMFAFFNSVDERGISHSKGDMTPMGPTLAWPTPKQTADITAAHEVTRTREAAYRAVATRVERELATGADALRTNTPLASLLSSSVTAALQAYYPLDSTYTASFADLMVHPDGVPVDVPRDTVSRRSLAAFPLPMEHALEDPDLPRVAEHDIDRATASARRAARSGRQVASGPTLPIGLSKDKLVWSPSAVKGVKPAALNNIRLIPGVKGSAALINDSIGLADHAIGFFDRTDPFTLETWVRLRDDNPYGEVTLLRNRYGRGPGYELQLQNNRLRFAVIHSEPYNQLAVVSKLELPKGRWIHIAATYDGQSRASGARLYVDGAPIDSTIEHDRLARSSMPQWGVGPFDNSMGFSWGQSHQREEFKDGAIDEIKVYTRALTPIEVAYAHDPARAALAAPETVRPQMLRIIVEQDPRVIAAWRELKAARESAQRIESGVYQVMVMADAPVVRRTFVLDHGLYDAPREEVQPQAIERVFRWKSSYPRNRLGLAQWLFDRDNPLTARVYVNRLWQGHFGNGLVETVEDFGTQGSNPTHPELLDWLAIDFVRSGWDIKHMHRLIVTSATYRQSSRLTPELVAKDPRNLLLARGPRYRLPAEAIRDSALFASGLLVDRPGGDSVFPYQPAGVWNSIGVPVVHYPTDVPDDQMHRRSMYTFVRRNAAFPSLVVFDMPDRNVASVARRISNTPLQALVLLNDPQYVEAYRHIAQRALETTTDADQRLVRVFRLATRRRPSTAELNAMRHYWKAELERLSRAPAEVARLLQIGVTSSSGSVAPAELAALTMVTAGVMNTPDAYSLR